MRSLVGIILSLAVALSNVTYASDLLEFESSTPSRKTNPYQYPVISSTTGTEIEKASKIFKLKEIPKLFMKAQLPNGNPATMTVVELPYSSNAQLKEILSEKGLENSDVLLSTDQVDSVKATAEVLAKPNDKRQLRVIALGKLAAAKDTLAAGFKSYYDNAKKTLSGDRIGLTVLIITAGVDSFIWINSTSLEIHQKTSMLLMNFVMAATFGLDRDLWGKITAPVKNRMINLFDRFLIGDRLNGAKILVSQYLSNMVMGVGIQLIRTGLLSLDNIGHAVTTSDFWLTAVKISSLVTLTTFAWSELFSSIDSEKNPVTKMMLKRLGEMRGIIMCQLASISMVLQPHTYGSTPIYSFIVHGSLGLLALANADRIVAWLENSPRVRSFYRKIETFENFINSSFQAVNPIGGVRSCRSLFVE